MTSCDLDLRVLYPRRSHPLQTVVSDAFAVRYTLGMRYTVIFETQTEGGYHAFCPALPGCHSEGDTLDEATANIREAIAAYLESLQAHGEPLPVENILIKPLEVVIA